MHPLDGIMKTSPTIQEAKATLRRSLANHAGDTTQTAVVTAIQSLAKLNPTPAPARNFQLQEGHWWLTNAPNFPNGERQADGRYVYTLGRLAFNMFQPKHLKVVIDRVSKSIRPRTDSPWTHDIQVEFTVLEDAMPPLQGIVQNLGVCEPYDDDTLQVQFTGGTLTPQPGTDLATWVQVFGDQTPTGRTQKRSLKEMLSDVFLRFMFGLVPPNGINPDTGEVTFEMTRSPNGKLRILYLDDDMRIVKGRKEAMLVCDRLSSSG